MTDFFATGFLVSVDFSNFNTSELNDMHAMFYNSLYLKSIVWGDKFSTSKVTRMDLLFGNCFNLTTVNLTNFNTSKVTTFKNMFYDCISIKELNVSSFDTSSATYFFQMFCHCNSLTSIDLSNFNTKCCNNAWYVHRL